MKTTIETPPIACTLAPSEFKDRLAWIDTLTRDALRGHERRDLVLDLWYAPEAVERVREMVRNERACCSFLTFELRELPNEIRLTIAAPEAARETADMLFEQFVARAPASSACACAPPSASKGTSLLAGKELGAKAAGLTAVTLAAGAVACGACCVLPFALPAAVLAGSGSILALLANAHAWVTGVSILAVIGAWSVIVWQAVRSRRRPAVSTLYMMVGATALLSIAVLWPIIEPHLVRALRA
jgi:hypothetical protein